MKKLKPVIITLLVIVIIVIVALVAINLYMKSKYSKMTFKPIDTTDLGIEEKPEEDKKDIEKYTKFVVFGSDSRDENNAYSGRSDTIIIIVINNEDKAINLISIPRDTYVNVPGYGMTKINHAYAYGQEQLSIKTINSYFGLDLTQYLTIDFSGLVECIDRVGGVEVTLDQSEVDYINRSMSAEDKIASAGTVTLNGKQALMHSRNRTIGNDFTRAARQRQILVALMNKVVDMNTNDINALIDELSVNVTTNIDFEKYKKMLKDVASDRKEYLSNINSVQIPSVDYGYDSMIDGIYYFGFDLDRAKEDLNKYYYFK